MSNEFLDYIEDILDAMDKAKILVEDVTFDQFQSDFRFILRSFVLWKLSGKQPNASLLMCAKSILIFPGVVWRVCEIGFRMATIESI